MTATNDSYQARLAALYDVSTRLAETLDLQKLLDSVMDAIIELTNAERGFIMLIDEPGGNLEIVAARHFEKSTITGLSAEISQTVVERSVATGETILTSNAQEDTRFADFQSVVGYQLRSIMCVPLRARGRIIGAAYVDNRFMSAVFGQQDLELLVTFINQASLAIDNARLFTQTDQALDRRVEELSVFQQIDHQLNRQLDLKRVLSLALDWAVGLTNATSGSLGLIEDLSSDTPILKILADKRDPLGGTHPFDPHHPIVTQVVATGEAASSRHQTSFQGAPVTQLIVPIKREGIVIGLILLSSPLAKAFPVEDIEFVERLADRASVAIENSRLYEEVRNAKQAQSDFVAVVTHELRAPMTVIHGYTDLLRQKMVGELNEQQIDLLEIVNSNVERMGLLIQDLSDLNRIEMGQLQLVLTEFDIKKVVRSVTMSNIDAIKAKGQKLSTKIPADVPMVYADRKRTEQILTNLVTNAHKYSSEGAQIGVRVRPLEDHIELDIIDNGIGISDADLESLFTQFFRAESDAVQDESGWGLGLTIVKMLVEAQGGAIQVKSAHGKGSVFTFSLPLAATQALQPDIE